MCPFFFYYIDNKSRKKKAPKSGENTHLFTAFEMNEYYVVGRVIVELFLYAVCATSHSKKEERCVVRCGW